MPSRAPMHMLELLLRQCYATPRCHKLRRTYVTIVPKPKAHRDVRKVAILGGGITGLATAYYLSKSLRYAKITLYEASSRLGGWLHSQEVDVGTGKVVFEQGPRNLRPTKPNGLLTLDLARDVGLEDRLLMTSKNSVAAQNRFIYYPDHLVRMLGPGASLFQNISNVLSEPVFDGTISGILSEVTKPKRPETLYDESIGSFISRRFGSTMAENVVSAVFHGIFAGDIYNLSARTVLPALWYMEQQDRSIVRGQLRNEFGRLKFLAKADLDLLRRFRCQPKGSETLEEAKNSSIFTFKRGIGELADRLEAKLSADSNVVILRNTAAQNLEFQSSDKDLKVKLTTGSSISGKRTDEDSFTHVISTIAGTKLAGIVDKTCNLAPLRQTSTVTVMVVNLFFSNPAILPVHGFGYLLPRSIPLKRNPERALGVIFDTDACIGQDAVQGTKVTVLLGGHWWNDLGGFPDEDEGASMAKAVLKRHLGIEEAPQAIRVKLQYDCIPQYSVGHDERMEEVSRELAKLQGRLRVAGSSYTGVGVNDCVRAAMEVVEGLVDGREKKTGLDVFLGGRQWSWYQPEVLGHM